MIVNVGKKIWKRGDLFIWLTGAGLALSLILTTALLMAIVVNAMGSFWPGEIQILNLKDGSKVLGTQVGRENIPNYGTPDEREETYRVQIKKANRDIYNSDFVWIDEAKIKIVQHPEEVVAVARREWGYFFGYIKEVLDGDQVIARGTPESLKVIQDLLHEVTAKNKKIETIEKKDIGAINYKLERVRLKLKRLNLKGVSEGPEVDVLNQEIPELQSQYLELEKILHELRASQTRIVILQTVEGQEKALPLAQVLDIYNPNSFSLLGKLSYFIKSINNFFWDDPREANTEGGVFPAIFGTVLMVMMMSLLATPLGVLAAFYLREYARQGTMVSIV
ncbi:MAG: phosphate ABC transporter permease PstA, partial [Verrucomicrobiia bacterium]